MIVTNCNKCSFYENHECQFHMPDILLKTFPMVFNESKFQNDQIYDFYCPYARTAEWLKVKTDAGLSDDAIMNEVLSQKPSYTIIYFVDDNLQNFENNIQILSSNDYGYMYLVSKSQNNNKLYLSILEKYKTKNWKYHAILDQEMTECEIIDMILDASSIETELVYVINNKYSIDQDNIETILNTFNLLRYHQVVFIPEDIFTFHNIVIPMQLWKYKSKRIGLAFEELENDSTIIRFSI